MDEIIYTPDARFSGRQIIAWRDARGKAELQPGTLINTYLVDHISLTMRPGALWMPFHDEQWAWTNMLAFLLDLPIFLGRDAPTIAAIFRTSANDRFESLGLRRGKTVVMFPYAQTVMYRQDKASMLEHFINLAEQLQQAGFSVCTSIAGEEVPIDGTHGVFVPFNELIPFCEAAGHAVTIRSGISDILSAATCRKLHIYPNPYSAQYLTPIAYGLGGMEENVSFNFESEGNPSKFCELIIKRLVEPPRAEAASFVPQQVLDLLALPTGLMPVTGQFRSVDLMVRSDCYRLCASGVLAEGWSGLEHAGVWNIGARSVVYLRPATGILPVEEAQGSSDIVLRLELGFAIRPATQPVLFYAISINGQAPMSFEAQWADGKTSHWPEGPWRTLRFPMPREALTQPVKITFMVTNPISANVLHGITGGDGRVIGIELLRATYEVAARDA